MNILLTRNSQKRFGGTVYLDNLLACLKDSIKIEEINIRSKASYWPLLELPLIFYRIFKISKRKDANFIIKSYETSLFLNKNPTKNIAIIHHLDHRSASPILRIIYSALKKIIMRNLKKFEAVVVVSNYWKKYFIDRHYQNVHLIYNSFNLNHFNFTEEEIDNFKNKFHLSNKPILYLGNCQKSKGAIEAYKKLKGLDVYLVTSGKRYVSIPTINLELDYKNFLRLLKASTVVITMSKFKEGWCRIAHEAMLCKTPVIGSGQGGMQELLEGGKQIICQNFSELKDRVEYLLSHQSIAQKMGNDGYFFAKQFTEKKFAEDWLNLLHSLYEK